MKQIEVALGIVVHEGLVLICQRREQDKFGGYWEFPGGKRETEETIEQTLHREMTEELDVEVEIAEALPPIQYEYPDVIVTLHPFVCRWVGGEPKAIASQQFIWTAPEHLANYQFPPANEHLIQWLGQHLSQASGIDSELDTLRIRQVARARGAAMRFRSYCLIGASACTVTAIDLIWRGVRRYMLEQAIIQTAVYLLAAAFLAWPLMRLLAKAQASARKLACDHYPNRQSPRIFRR